MFPLPLVLGLGAGVALLFAAAGKADYKHIPPATAQAIKKNLADNKNPTQLKALAASLRTAAAEASMRGDPAAAADYNRAAAALDAKAADLGGGFDPVGQVAQVLTDAGPVAPTIAAQVAQASQQPGPTPVPAPTAPHPVDMGPHPLPALVIPPIVPIPMPIPMPSPMSPPGGGFSTGILSQGSHGPEVLTWQQFLAAHAPGGLDFSSGPGTFGPRTTVATKAFQSSQGLVADGKVGPATKAAASRVLASGGGAPMIPVSLPAIPIPVPSPDLMNAPNLMQVPGWGGGPLLSSTIQQGSSGPDVLRWQQFLAKAVGLDFSSGPGTFGPRTTAATKAFQSSRGLAADGIVNPQTQAAAAATGLL